MFSLAAPHAETRTTFAPSSHAFKQPHGKVLAARRKMAARSVPVVADSGASDESSVRVEMSAEVEFAALQRQVSSSVDVMAVSDFVDEEALLAASTFPISPEELVDQAKSFLAKASAGDYDENSFADTFEFAGPVVGPLGKTEFLTAIRSFQLKEGIPDLNGNLHHFRVDPFDTCRVWFTSFTTGTHTGKLANMFEATGKEIRSTPQSCSLSFDEEGKITQYTIGYPMDRRVGNTGGLGGVFGIFYAIGKPLPFPEANPWKKSKRYRFFNVVGKITTILSKWGK